MGRLGVIGAGLVTASALGQVATFTPLRGTGPQFGIVGGLWASGIYPVLSGDGNSATDGRWRWSRTAGVIPAGFVPGFNQSSDFIRQPHDLSFDGSVEVGALRYQGQQWSVYWESPGRFDLLPINGSSYLFVASQTLSDDGRWMFYSQNGFPFTRYRVQRNGTPESMPGSSMGIWSPSRTGNACLADNGVLRIGPNETLSGATYQPAPPSSLSPTALSSDGRLAAGYGFPGDLGAIWNTETDQIDRFTPPFGFRHVSGEMFLSDSGDLVIGSAGIPQSVIRRAFVRRPGEQARELRVVLDRFGDTSSNYYILDRAAGLSRDGKTLLVLYSSPLWYGDGAAIVTLPDWEPCPSDLNFDGFVDDADFSIFAKAYDRLTTTDGDLNVDRFTDDADFSIFAVAYDALLCP